MSKGKLWTQQDRYKNDIYLTAERWKHIIDPDNHPELEPYLDRIRETIKRGRRKQDPIRPNAYTYSLAFKDLPDDKTHIIVAVIFRLIKNEQGEEQTEKFITTAYFKERD